MSGTSEATSAGSFAPTYKPEEIYGLTKASASFPYQLSLALAHEWEKHTGVKATSVSLSRDMSVFGTYDAEFNKTPDDVGYSVQEIRLGKEPSQSKVQLYLQTEDQDKSHSDDASTGSSAPKESEFVEHEKFSSEERSASTRDGFFKAVNSHPGNTITDLLKAVQRLGEGDPEASTRGGVTVSFADATEGSQHPKIRIRLPGSGDQ